MYPCRAPLTPCRPVEFLDCNLSQLNIRQSCFPREKMWTNLKFGAQKSPSPTNCDNPFQERDDVSDVVLIVEDKRLYVHKTFLAVYSPVFQRMFFSTGFREREAEEVPLPGKKHVDVISFLLQLYPVHFFKPITDEILAQVLPLADEYQVEHVHQKCLEYIGQRLTKTLTADQVLLYLSLCERHNVRKHHEALVKLAIKGRALDLLNSKYYLHVPPDTMRNILTEKLRSEFSTFHKEQNDYSCTMYSCSSAYQFNAYDQRERVNNQLKRKSDPLQTEKDQLKIENAQLKRHIAKQNKQILGAKHFRYFLYFALALLAAFGILY